MPTQTIRTVCPHDCPDQCSILAQVSGGRLVQVEGDPNHPFTRGILCAKVNRYPERVHSPARLLTPLRRTGPKGEGRFEPVTWEQALDEIAHRWRKLDPRSILGYAYSGSMGLIHRNLVAALFNLLGGRRMLMSTICDTTYEAGWTATLGHAPGADPETIPDSDLIIGWGANTVTVNLHAAPLIDTARAKGARFVVIDPYRTRTAARADLHLKIRPGTDAALALGLIHLLVRDGLADRAYLAAQTSGFELLEAQLLPDYTPERVAAITGLAQADIEQLARWYGEASAPFLRIGSGLSRATNGGMAIRTITCLPAVVGEGGKRGGGALMDVGAIWSLDLESVRLSHRHPRPQEEPVNHALLGQALQDPSLKAVFIAANNPAVTCPDLGAVFTGLSRDDLFTVVHDLHLTDTARYADLVLPACTSFETADLYRSYGSCYLQYGPQVLEPLGESRPNGWVMAQLARRLGLTDPVFTRPIAEHVARIVAPMGWSADQVLAGGPVRAPHPGGPVHTRFHAPELEAAGLPGLPVWRPDPVAATEGARYGLQLLTAPGHHQHHTAFAGVESLQEREGAPRVLIHPADAAARSIIDGQPVALVNDRGEVGLTAAVTDTVQPGLVVVEGHRDRSRYLTGGPINLLTSSRLADMGDGATYLSTWVEARPLHVR